MILETDRLILRHFTDDDAEDVFKYARDPDVGPAAGWPPHKSVDESLDIIRNVLSYPETYAICLKEDGKAIGVVDIRENARTDLTDKDDECELGYWLGRPFWGRGIMPEAVREILKRAFTVLGMKKVWAGYYEGNEKSKRVQEKCGFKHKWMTIDVDVPQMKGKRTGHVNCISREEWESSIKKK